MLVDSFRLLGTPPPPDPIRIRRIQPDVADVRIGEFALGPKFAPHSDGLSVQGDRLALGGLGACVDLLRSLGASVTVRASAPR